MQESLLRVQDGNYDQFVNSERAVLIFTRSDCEACSEYTDEIEQGTLKNPAFEGISFGKVVLDEPGAAKIKRENPWLAQLDYVPYTVLYKPGHQVDGFAAARAGYLEDRIREHLVG